MIDTISVCGIIPPVWNSGILVGPLKMISDRHNSINIRCKTTLACAIIRVIHTRVLCMYIYCIYYNIYYNVEFDWQSHFRTKPEAAVHFKVCTLHSALKKKWINLVPQQQLFAQQPFIPHSNEPGRRTRVDPTLSGVLAPIIMIRASAYVNNKTI